ncbi:MAG: hypothetical protein GXO87_05195 [Chlorobi bacterium]|nr:hypothetical protein [Chlorobiota bacterium]
MKKIIIVAAAILISALSLQAQSITSTLGGNGLTDAFDIKNNNGDLLFRLNGVGNLGLGVFAPANKLDVDGSLNLTSTNSYKINDSPVINCYDNNTFIGFGTGSVNGGSSNTFVGKDAGSSNTSGEDNAFFGYKAGNSVTTSTRNVMLGSEAGRSAVGTNCIFIGFQTGYIAQGFSNIFIGNSNGRISTGNFNLAIGLTAGYDLTSGSHNIFMGTLTGYKNTTGSYNVFVGSQAGYDNLTGNKNVFIGYNAGFAETGSNKLYIDNSSTTSPLIYGDFSTDDVKINGDLTVTGTITEISDARYKKNIAPIENASEKIQRINGVYYNWDKEKHPELVTGSGREIGVLAQDVEKVFPELVKTDEKGFKSVNYSKLSAILIEAVKEQQTNIEALQKELNDVKNKMEEYYIKHSNDNTNVSVKTN